MTNKNLHTLLYKYIFWTGYFAVLILSFLTLTGDLTRIKLGPGNFKIRLDHLLHFLVYFLICLYFLFGMKKGFSLFKRNSFLKFFIAVIFLATVTEIIQLWVPSRSFNVFDLVANVTGVAIGSVIIRGTG